jgi:hypothetical protein
MFGSLATGDGMVINMFGSPVIIVSLLVLLPNGFRVIGFKVLVVGTGSKVIGSIRINGLMVPV